VNAIPLQSSITDTAYENMQNIHIYTHHGQFNLQISHHLGPADVFSVGGAPLGLAWISHLGPT